MFTRNRAGRSRGFLYLLICGAVATFSPAYAGEHDGDRHEGNEHEGKWIGTWAFAIRDDVAKKEKYDSKRIKGTFEFAPSFPGCPNCGRERPVSMSSMRSRKRPPAARAASQPTSAESACPRCSSPFGLGAKRKTGRGALGMASV